MVRFSAYLLYLSCWLFIYRFRVNIYILIKSLGEGRKELAVTAHLHLTPSHPLSSSGYTSPAIASSPVSSSLGPGSFFFKKKKKLDSEVRAGGHMG